MSSKIENHGLWPYLKTIGILPVLFLAIAICSCKKANETELKSKANSPPVIVSISIIPEKPTRENELSLVIEDKDLDKDPITYHYQWIRNGEDILGENKNVLGSSNFKKGDTIQVKVTPNDGKDDGKPFISNSVKIYNSLPFIQEVSIEPKTAYANSDLKMMVKSFDSDGDFIYYIYQWEKNGIILDEERDEVLIRGNFKKGDTIVANVIPDDREMIGIQKKSEPVTILNSPPGIISSPLRLNKGDPYFYKVEANDPDNDTIVFIIISGPKGIKIDEKTGLISWTVKKEDIGNHVVEIQATDNEGGWCRQKYTLTVQYKAL